MTPLLRHITGIIALSIGTHGISAQSPEDSTAIRDAYREWPRAVEAGDIDRFMSFVDDSITVLAPGAPAIVGAAAYRQALKPLLARFDVRVRVDPPRRLEVAGSWAFVQYSGILTTVPRTGGDTSVVRRRYVDVLRRQHDGTWRLFLHTFHGDVPGAP